MYVNSDNLFYLLTPFFCSLLIPFLLLSLLSCLLCLYFYWSRDHSSFSVGFYSRYSDSLLTGRFGARILVGAKFSVLSRPAPRPTQPPVQWVPGLSRCSSGRNVVLTTHLLLVPGFEWVRAVVSFYLRTVPR